MSTLVRAAFLLGFAFVTTGCLEDIPGGQLQILGDTTHTTFAGNDEVKNGKYGDAKSGFTLEEGFAGVIDIEVGKPDEKTGIVDGSDFPEVVPNGVAVSVVADSNDKRYLVTVSRAADGSLPTSASLDVSDSDYKGSFSIPIRIVAQEGAGPHEDPLPWPYGNTQTSSSTGSASSSTGSGGDGGAGGGF